MLVSITLNSMHPWQVANDVPEVRRIFHQFHVREIELAYTAQQAAGKRFRELLITNYEPGESKQ
jgi:hypothetical protein